MKYVHPHNRQLKDNAKVAVSMDRILKTIESLRRNEKVWSNLADEDAEEIAAIEERMKKIAANYRVPA